MILLAIADAPSPNDEVSALIAVPPWDRTANLLIPVFGAVPPPATAPDLVVPRSFK